MSETTNAETVSDKIIKGLRFVEAEVPGVVHVVEEIHAKYAFGDKVGPAVTLKQEGSDSKRVVSLDKVASDYAPAS